MQIVEDEGERRGDRGEVVLGDDGRGINQTYQRRRARLVKERYRDLQDVDERVLKVVGCRQETSSGLQTKKVLVTSGWEKKELGRRGEGRSSRYRKKRICKSFGARR